MPPAPPPGRAARRKAVTFCARCSGGPRARARPPAPPDPDRSYHSDPGRPRRPRRRPSAPADARYYSEPDAKYFEIDYAFLRELRRIARSNCAKCRRRRGRRGRAGEAYVLCNGGYHAEMQHCRLCCRVCGRPAAPASPDDYSLASKSYSHGSFHSNKSVSFLESSAEGSPKGEPNYTATSFTNDLKKFLLKPSSPRLSLREKFIISLKQELEATKRSPKLRAIKGLWKSY